MAGPRPHGECVNGTSVVGGAVGRPGMGQKQERGEVNICGQFTNSPPTSLRAQVEKIRAEPCGICPYKPVWTGWDPSQPVLFPQTQGSSSHLGLAGHRTGPNTPLLGILLWTDGNPHSQGPLRSPCRHHSTLSLKP